MQIIELHRKNIEELALKFGVTKLILFGSALEIDKEPNDIDLVCDGIYDRRFFTFSAQLEEIFKKNVDLIPLKPESEFVREIIKKGKVIYDSGGTI